MEVELIPDFLATMIYEDVMRFPDRAERIACIARYLRLEAQVARDAARAGGASGKRGGRVNAFDAATLFKALSVPPRIAIVRILAEHPDTLTVIDLENRMDAAGFSLCQETISHHLVILRAAGLVTYRHHWHNHYYSLCPAAFAAMAEVLQTFMAEVEVAV